MNLTGLVDSEGFVEYFPISELLLQGDAIKSAFSSSGPDKDPDNG